MNRLEELKKELRKLLASIKEYRALGKDERTEELRTAFQANMDRVEEVEAEIREEERAIELENRNNATINGNPADLNGGDGSGRIEVQDQPIYRGNCTLGQQARDWILSFKDKGGASEARERLGQVEKRERELRAAGVGMVESVASDGGFLVEGESAIDLMTNGWNNNAVLPRTDNISIGGAFYDEIGVDESSRTDGNRGGGVRWYSDAELDEVTSSKTKLKKTRWEPERLTSLYYLSNEIDSDVPALQSEMNKLFGEELNYKQQDLVINGSGVGEALGLLSSGAVVSVAKEAGQAAATIVHDNTVKMLARVKLTNMRNLAWLCNQDTLPQLMTMTIDVGTGGELSKAFVPNLTGAPGTLGTLHGFPVIPIEQCATLGTAGDLLLTDLRGYKTVNKGGVESAVSAHVKFLNNQLAVRLVTRFGGQPKINSPITPAKGSSTVSYFVKLATRS